MGRLKKRLLPRRTLNAREIVTVMDSWNYPQRQEFPITLTNCGVQPVTGKETFILEEGVRDKKCFVVYTETEITVQEEGLDEAYQNKVVEIEAEPGVWCRVIKSDPWDSYDIQAHYRLVAVETNER